MRQILRKKPADLDWIQRQGLMAVKLAQIFALRPDLLGEENANNCNNCTNMQPQYHQKIGKKP